MKKGNTDSEYYCCHGPEVNPQAERVIPIPGLSIESSIVISIISGKASFIL